MLTSVFIGKPVSICEGGGKEGRLGIEMLELILSKPLLISKVHIPKADSHSSPSLTSVCTLVLLSRLKLLT